MEELIKDSKRTKLAGIKAICLILIVPIILQLLFSLLTTQMVKLPDSRKSELIQLEQYKRLNINSIDELDAFFKNALKQTITPWFIFLSIVALILVFGLWNLKKWARVGLISYSIFTIVLNILWFSPRVAATNSIMLAKFISLIVSIIFIYYLTRPKVKERFEQKLKTIV